MLQRHDSLSQRMKNVLMWTAVYFTVRTSCDGAADDVHVYEMENSASSLRREPRGVAFLEEKFEYD